MVILNLKKIKTFVKALLVVVLPLVPEIASARFENYQIRVVRPRYFNKGGRFELGAQGTAVMNDTFVYTYMATGILGYHFSNTLALEFAGSVGFSMDKEEKRILKDEFDVRTQIFRTFYSAEGALQYTPIYGKWQLPSGRLIYFDSYIHFGGGLTGIDWQYDDFCVATKDPTTQQDNPIPTNQTVPYPTFVIGFGQRFFISKKNAIKWDIRNHSMNYSQADTACNPDAEESGGSAWHHNITMQLGLSKFF